MSTDNALTGLECVGCIAYRQYAIDGKCNVGRIHAHNYDHTTVILSGAATIEYFDQIGWLDDGEPHLEKIGQTSVRSEDDPQGRFIVVPKNRHHRIKAESDTVIYACIFSHRDSDGVVVETYEGNQDAYI